MLNIVLFGPPGAGKGTQAEKLIEKYGLSHISTGDVMRREIESGSELGRSMKRYTDKGELAPDQLVIDIVADYVGKNINDAGSIFDGFPRTTAQAESLDKIMEHQKLSITMMISLEVPDEELIKRLLNRGKESGRADDLDRGIIQNRLDVYKEVTASVAEYYKRQGKHISIDGAGDIEQTFERMCAAIVNKQR